MEHDEIFPENKPAEDGAVDEVTAADTPDGRTPTEEETPPAVSEGEAAPTAVPEEGERPDYQRLAEEDLAVLRAAVPELAGAASLSALSDPGRYGELREAGLDPLEAYLATEGRRLLSRPRDNRTHLVSSLGRTASSAGDRIGAAELHAARDLFPGLGDGEIEALWRRARSAGRR